jgi:hypothetical protein
VIHTKDQTMNTESTFSVGFGGDVILPDWENTGRVHDWRNYISEELRHIWWTFTVDQKMAIARNADDMADRERWD